MFISLLSHQFPQNHAPYFPFYSLPRHRDACLTGNLLFQLGEAGVFCFLIYSIALLFYNTWLRNYMNNKALVFFISSNIWLDSKLA